MIQSSVSLRDVLGEFFKQKEILLVTKIEYVIHSSPALSREAAVKDVSSLHKLPHLEVFQETDLFVHFKSS